MAKADSMLSIIWLLRSRNRMTAKEIADILEISVRTVYRYIDALCASGVPIMSESGHDGGFSLLKNFLQVPLFFDEEERKALSHASMFAKQANYPFTDALNQALRKIEHQLNQEQMDRWQLHSKGLDVLNTTRYDVASELLKELEKAVVDCNKVVIQYRKRKNEQLNQRQLDPYGLIHWNHKWYVVGYCYLREEIRSFRVDRIETVQTTESHFTKPHDFLAGDYFIKSIQPVLDHTKENITVILTGALAVLDYLCEGYLRHYLSHRGSVEAQFVIDKKMKGQFCQMILAYGDRIQIKAPVEMQNELVAQAQKIIQQY